MDESIIVTLPSCGIFWPAHPSPFARLCFWNYYLLTNLFWYYGQEGMHRFTVCRLTRSFLPQYWLRVMCVLRGLMGCLQAGCGFAGMLWESILANGKNVLEVSWFTSHREQQRVETTFNKPFRSKSSDFPFHCHLCKKYPLLNGQCFFLQCSCCTLSGIKKKFFMTLDRNIGKMLSVLYNTSFLDFCTSSFKMLTKGWCKQRTQRLFLNYLVSS